MLKDPVKDVTTIDVDLILSPLKLKQVNVI